MIHVLSHHNSFNIPETIFNTEFKLSFNYIGNFLVNNYIGPSGCNAIDKTCRNSFKKGYSEAIERRALMIGGYTNQKEYVDAYNLITKNIESIPVEYSRFKNTSPFYSDTTGTAAHPKSEYAVYKAVVELLEKNSLFLFWYGLVGKRLDVSCMNSELVRSLQHQGKIVDFYLNDTFYPLNTVITIIHNGKDFIYSGGVAGSFNIYKAVLSSLEEAYLLMWQNYFHEKISSNNYFSRPFESKDYYTALRHIENVQGEEKVSTRKDFSNKPSINRLIEELPCWIKSLHIIMLRHTLNIPLKICLAFSKDLNNHIPLKKRIDLDTTINKCTINLDINKLEKLPECVIV